MTLRYFSFSFIVLLVLSSSASAQSVDRTPFFTHRDGETAINRALTLLPKVKCGKEQCTPATTEEFVSPPVDVADAREALIVATRSARLKWCGLEWRKRTFPAMMYHFQQRGIRSVRALAVLGIVHNQQFGKYYINLQALKTCSEAMRAELDKKNPVFEIMPWHRRINNALLDRSVADLLQRVLNEIQLSRCGKELCAPATEAEKASPPVTIEQARRAMKVGLLSGTAQFCGLDWKKQIFFPFLAVHRSHLKMSMRQLAIISMLHSTMHGFVLENYKKQEKPCTDKMRSNIKKQISGK